MDLYQNNGMDKNRIYIKELYLFDITALVNCKVDPICCKYNASKKLLHQIFAKRNDEAQSKPFFICYIDRAMLMITHHQSSHLLYSVRAIHSPLQFCNLSLL